MGGRVDLSLSLLQPETPLCLIYILGICLRFCLGGKCRLLLSQTQINKADPEMLHTGERAPSFPCFHQPS